MKLDIGDSVRLAAVSGGAGVSPSFPPYDSGKHVFEPPFHDFDRELTDFVRPGCVGTVTAVHKWTNGVVNCVVKFKQGYSILSGNVLESVFN